MKSKMNISDYAYPSRRSNQGPATELAILIFLKKYFHQRNRKNVNKLERPFQNI